MGIHNLRLVCWSRRVLTIHGLRITDYGLRIAPRFPVYQSAFSEFRGVLSQNTDRPHFPVYQSAFSEFRGVKIRKMRIVVKIAEFCLFFLKTIFSLATDGFSLATKVAYCLLYTSPSPRD